MIKVWMLIFMSSIGVGNVAHISQFETKEECEKMKLDLAETGALRDKWMIERTHCIYGSSPFYYKIGEK